MGFKFKSFNATTASIILIVLLFSALYAPKFLLNKFIKNLNSDYSDYYKSNLIERKNFYINQDFGFSINFPSNWEIKQPEFSDDIIIKAIIRDNHKLAALNIYAWHIEDIQSTKQLLPQELMHKYHSVKGEMMDSGIDYIDGIRAKWLKVKVENDFFTTYNLAYFISIGDILYSLVGNTVLGDEEWFDLNQPYLLDAIKSFKLEGD
jgi:hypothetical protein